LKEGQTISIKIGNQNTRHIDSSSKHSSIINTGCVDESIKTVPLLPPPPSAASIRKKNKPLHKIFKDLLRQTILAISVISLVLLIRLILKHFLDLFVITSDKCLSSYIYFIKISAVTLIEFRTSLQFVCFDPN